MIKKYINNIKLENQKLALIGENGSGKTFLLQHLSKHLDKKTTLIIDIKPSFFASLTPGMPAHRFEKIFGYEFKPFKNAAFIDIHNQDINIDIAKYEAIIVNEGWQLLPDSKLLRKVQEFVNMPSKTLIITMMQSDDLQRCGVISDKFIENVHINKKSNLLVELHSILGVKNEKKLH